MGCLWICRWFGVDVDVDLVGWVGVGLPEICQNLKMAAIGRNM